MTGRQVGDERARYGRKSTREQLEDLWEWIERHRLWIVAAAIFVGFGAWLALVSRNVRVEQLAVGECLYIPTAAADDPTTSKPIGSETDVELVLHVGGAESAACTSSHGHEVSLAESVAAHIPPTGYPSDQSDLRSLVQPDCEAAFQAYIGHPLDGSAFVTFAAVPSLEQWNAGDRTEVCLVARADGQWMTSPARGSGG